MSFILHFWPPYQKAHPGLLSILQIYKQFKCFGKQQQQQEADVCIYWEVVVVERGQGTLFWTPVLNCINCLGQVKAGVSGPMTVTFNIQIWVSDTSLDSQFSININIFIPLKSWDSSLTNDTLSI